MDIISASVSRCQSTTSKSSNSSISSILRDSSCKKPKKPFNVRFEDFPESYEKNGRASANESVTELDPARIKHAGKNSKNAKEKSTDGHFKSDRIINSFCNRNQSGSPKKQSPLKIVSVQEIISQDSDKASPKKLNFSFRDNEFYDKLSKFYCGNTKAKSQEGSPQEKKVERIYIKLGMNSLENIEEVKEISPSKGLLINLKPCAVVSPENKMSVRVVGSRGKSESPTKNNKIDFPKKIKRY